MNLHQVLLAIALLFLTIAVPLYFKMNCEVTEGGESRQMSIEREAYDFRSGPGCGAYTEPFRTVMRIGGVMTPEEEAQLAEAENLALELQSLSSD